MEKRPLGSQGLIVSAQGLGCMGMSQNYGDADESTSLATLHRALEIGVTFWDTANIYGDKGPGGFGANERLLAKVLLRHRDQVALATKIGIEGYTGDEKAKFRLDGRPENVVRRCNESLARLGTDYIDLYYLHRVDPETPIEETIGAMGDLVAAGKVRYVGVSGATPAELERACAIHPVSAFQGEWSLWNRDIESDLVPTARRLGVGLVPYYPLGRGFLTGALGGGVLTDGDARSRDPRFSDANFAANQAIVAEISAVAKTHDVLPVQVALAWLHGQGADVVPIPGTKRVRYLEQNAGALDLHLTVDECSRLDALAACVAGDRWEPASR